MAGCDIAQEANRCLHRSPRIAGATKVCEDTTGWARGWDGKTKNACRILVKKPLVTRLLRNSDGNGKITLR